MIDSDRARVAAREIVARLGGPAGVLTRAPSRSHHVFVGPSVVVKIIDEADHTRLDRETALAAELPAGLSAPVLASGRHRVGDDTVRYSCVARLPGKAPGMGLPGVDRPTARRWADQAVARLRRLHEWTPSEPTAVLLREPLEHGGFVGRAPLLDCLAAVRASAPAGAVPPEILDGLATLAARAPESAGTTVPVHADCHWDNWLVHDDQVTALLDFEWARFGAPMDDWMFLARFSGPHLHAVLDVIADATATPLDVLRAGCEIREAAHLTSDLRLALQAGEPVEELVRDLRTLVLDRSWWTPA